MEGSVGSRDNVLKSIHHLEGACGLSADDLANHINTALIAPMEDFEPLTHNPFRGMFLCLRAELWMMISHQYQSYLSLKSYALLTQPRHKVQIVSPDGSKRRTWTFWPHPHPSWISWISPFGKTGCPYLGKEQISSLSPNKDLSKTSTSTFAPFPLRLSCPRLQRIMLFMTDYNIPNHILCLIADFLLDRRQS